MPITLPPISRRQFLAGAAAAGTAVLCGRHLSAAEAPVDPHSWILTADTHIWRNRTETVRGVKMADNFEQVRAAVLSLSPRPAGLMIDGDCAFQSGEEEDYTLVGELVRPYLDAGIAVHMTLGNHDHRQRFLDGLAVSKLPKSPIDAKHVFVVETELVNWYMVDSLEKVGNTPVALGKSQLDWLARAIDERPPKPAIIVGHHHPIFPGDKELGLIDTEDLFAVLSPRRQVKAFVFGHTHLWGINQRDDIHLINLPPVAYLFKEGRPNGWVHAQLRADGMSIELHTLDPKHPENGQRHDLKWRA